MLITYACPSCGSTVAVDGVESAAAITCPRCAATVEVPAGAIVWAGLYPEGVRQWLTPAGFVDLTAPQLIAAGVAVATHVQACFDRQAVLEAEIEAGTITTPAEIDAATWPPVA